MVCKSHPYFAIVNVCEEASSERYIGFLGEVNAVEGITMADAGVKSLPDQLHLALLEGRSNLQHILQSEEPGYGIGWQGLDAVAIQLAKVILCDLVTFNWADGSHSCPSIASWKSTAF